MKPWLESFRRIAHASDEGWISLDSRKIYILPTRHGFLYGIAVFVMLIGSLNYNSNLGLLFAFLLAAIGLLGIIHTWRNLLGFEFSIGNATPVFAASKAAFPIRVRPMKTRKRAQIQIQAKQASVQLAGFNEDADTLIAMHVDTSARGDWPLGRLRVSSVFPLGLFRAWSYAAPTAHMLVYPRPADATGPAYSPSYLRSEKGDKGVGADDFVGSRTYRAGDSPRHIDWKAYAREKGLVTRLFGGDRAEQIWIQWDDFPGMPEEERLSRMCRLIIDAAAEDARYGVKLPVQQFAPDRGEAHKHRCLGALARYKQTA